MLFYVEFMHHGHVGVQRSEVIRRAGGNLAEPVHILVLVSVKGLSVFGPADGGLGDACGLTG